MTELEIKKETKMTKDDFPGLRGFLDEYVVRIVTTERDVTVYAVRYDDIPETGDMDWEFEVDFEYDSSTTDNLDAWFEGDKICRYFDMPEVFPKECGCWDPDTKGDFEELCSPGFCRQHEMFSIIMSAVTLADIRRQR